MEFADGGHGDLGEPKAVGAQILGTGIWGSRCWVGLYGAPKHFGSPAANLCFAPLHSSNICSQALTRRPFLLQVM